MRCALHLLKLKFRLAESYHVARLDRSSWSCSASHVDVISLKIFVSSAKAAILLDLTVFGKEFTYRRNNMGSRIDPWGTPEVTGKGLDVAPSIVTRWKRLCRYDSSHVSRFPPKPYWCSFLRSFAWFTVSKAFDMSRYMMSTWPPLSSFVPIWSRTSTSWVTQDRSATKPRWHALIRLKTWSLIALNKHLSMTLETIESSEIGL